jgi:WD40 repeat protein
MRADFYPRLAAYPEAAQLTAAHQALVAPLENEGLRQAIEEPARRVGLVLEEGLVDTILEDVEHQSGALPLLEHALLELWRRRRGTMLTLEAYRETGGVSGALARRADGVFESFTPEQQELARRTFLRLTQPGEGTEDTRRRAPLEELVSNAADTDAVDSVVRALVDARMLTTGGGGGERWVDVSHEALIRGWPRLRHWLDDDRTGLRVHRRLTEAATEWDRLEREEGTLYRGARLTEALEWRRRNDDALNPLERSFLDASAAVADRERRQAQRRIRWTIGGMTTALVLIATGAIVAVHQSEVASDQRDEAVSAADVARAANVLGDDPRAAVGLALDAVRAKRTPDATRVLRQAVAASRLRGTIDASARPLWAADATSDGSRAVTAGDDGVVRIWDLRSGRLLRVLRGHRSPVHAAAYSRDARLVVTAGDDGTARIWDAASGRQLRVLDARGGPMHAAAFSPDASLVVTGSSDHVGRIWRVADGALQRELRGHTAWVEDAAFSVDGSRVATAGGDGKVRVWDVASGNLRRTISTSAFAAAVAFGRGEAIATGDDDGLIRVGATVLRGHADTVWGLDFDDAGRLLASASGDHSARVWEPQSGQVIAVFRPHPSVVVSATFADGGRRVVTAAQDGEARVWAVEAERRRAAIPVRGGGVNGIAVAAGSGDVAAADEDGTVRVWRSDGALRERLVAPAPLNAVAIDAEGDAVVGASDDRTVRFWRDGKGRVLGHHDGPARTVALSPDGTTVASGGVDRAVRLWDTRSGRSRGVLRGHTAPVDDVAFSTDGRLLASVDRQGRLVVWDVVARRPVVMLEARRSLRSVAFGPRGTVAVGTEGGALRVASIDRRAWIASVEAHTSGVAGIAFAPSGTTLLTVSDDRDAHVWDLATWTPVARLRPTGTRLVGAGFAPDGRLIVAAENTVFVYSCDTCLDGAALERVAEERVAAARRRPGRDSAG